MLLISKKKLVLLNYKVINMGLFNPSCPKCYSRMKRHKQCWGTGCDSRGGCSNALRDKSNGMRCRVCGGAIYIGDTEDLK